MPQSLSNVLLHLVFSTKHRAPLLTIEKRRELYAYMATTLHNHGCLCLRVGGTEDHVHLLLQFPRTMTIAQAVEKVKSSSSKWLGPEFAWQAGYGVFSIGAREKDVILRYIDNQQEHHASVSFQEEFRALLREAGLEWGEKFVWD